MERLSKLTVIFACTSSLLGLSALLSPAAAMVLACTCDGGKDCRLQHGREQVDYSYDPSNMGAAYDAIEKTAMQQADAQAVTKATNAMNSDAKMRCGVPCGAPAFSILHGPPFAGGTNGAGMARSLWEVRYVCRKPPPQQPQLQPINPGGGNPQPPVGGGGERKVTVKIPEIPKCFGLPVDKDEMLDELHKMRIQQQLAGPLGADKDDPELIEAQAQAKVNIDAIDAAIKQVEETPLCDPRKAHSGFFDHVQIGIGIGVGGHDHHDRDYRDDRHHPDDKHGDDNHPVTHPSTHDDYPKTDQPPPPPQEQDDRD